MTNAIDEQTSAKRQSAPGAASWVPGRYSQSMSIKTLSVYGEVVLATFVINLFALAIPLFVMHVYDRVISHNATETLRTLSIGVVCVLLFDVVINSLRAGFLSSLGARADRQLQRRMYRQLLDLKCAWKPKDSGVFTAHLQNFDRCRDLVASGALISLLDIPFALLFIAVIWQIGGVIALVPLLGLPVAVVLALALHCRTHSAIDNNQRASAMARSLLHDSLLNLETLKISGAEAHRQQRWEQLTDGIAEGNARIERFTGTVTFAMSGFRQLATVLVIVAGVDLIQSGKLSAGGLIACFMLSERASRRFSRLISTVGRLQSAHLSYRRIDRLMKLPVERPSERHYIDKPKFKGNIRFENVYLRYSDQPAPALSNLNVQINAGDKVAVLGRMGSGKSSLLRLLVNLYEPTKGNITIDGLEIRQIDPRDLRRHIGYMPQEIVLNNASLRENITLGNASIDDAGLIRAANLSGVNVIAGSHPDGFDMQVGERGCCLSGGQRQAVALARALLPDPPILLLDEPTVSMDTTTEEWIKRNLSRFLAGKTLLLITQNPSLLDLVDHIIILDKGKLVAAGPKEQVLETVNRPGGN